MTTRRDKEIYPKNSDKFDWGLIAYMLIALVAVPYGVIVGAVYFMNTEGPRIVSELLAADGSAPVKAVATVAPDWSAILLQATIIYVLLMATYAGMLYLANKYPLVEAILDSLSLMC